MEFDKRLPIYQQVQSYVKQQIVAGIYQPGQELQSRREIAQELKINPNTVQRAFKELEEEALIITEANRPSRVTEDLQQIDHTREILLDQAIQTFYKSIAPLKIKPQQLIEKIQIYIDQDRGEQDA